ncbi:MAG TPA: hypothetical protein VL053_06950 [Arachidicoccus sp.]|nr:hypothetical protein [Arachidicoccus sp.]
MPAQDLSITKGLVTWTQNKVLDSMPVVSLLTVNIYDDKGRVIRTKTRNFTGGIDVTTTQYSWAGWPLVVVQKQEEKKGTTTQTSVVVTKMTYDDLGRGVRTEQKQSNSNVTGGMTNYAILSEVQYNVLGQVEKRDMGRRRSSATTYTTTALESQEYDYNIRGWLLGLCR